MWENIRRAVRRRKTLRSIAIRLFMLFGLIPIVCVFAVAIWAAVWLLPPMLVQLQLGPRSMVTERDRLKEIDAVRISIVGPVATLIGAMAVLAGALVAYLNTARLGACPTARCRS